VRRLALGLLLALLAGCGEDEVAASDPAALRDEAWVLSSGIDVAGWEEFAPSATFTQADMSGSSGCNRYRAPYTVDGDRMRLGAMATTKMACPGLGGEVEQAFTTELERVSRWAVDEGELVLYDGDDERLRFRTASPAGRWEVTGIRLPDSVSSPLPGTTLTATFGDDGKLSGNAGCNPYSTTYTTEGDTIEIAPPAAGEAACEKAIMEQEQAYLQALPTAATYTVDGSILTLLKPDGTIVATFAR
jgi:heat shock protein HslJ